MTFNEFQAMNQKRCQEAFDPDLHDLSFYAIAIAGEVGEMCNEYKKVLRGDYVLPAVHHKILMELADIITYCDLMITKLNANTEQVLLEKFFEVSERVGWDGTK